MRIKERDPDTGELKEEFKEINIANPTQTIADLKDQIAQLTATLGDFILGV